VKYPPSTQSTQHTRRHKTKQMNKSLSQHTHKADSPDTTHLSPQLTSTINTKATRGGQKKCTRQKAVAPPRMTPPTARALRARSGLIRSSPCAVPSTNPPCSSAMPEMPQLHACVTSATDGESRLHRARGATRAAQRHPVVDACRIVASPRGRARPWTP